MPVILSRCHDAICQEDMAADGETLIYKCSICNKVMDKSAYVYKEDDSEGDPFANLPLKDENTTPSAVNSPEDVVQDEVPIPPAFEVKEGKIYQDGQLIGKSLSDKEWFKEKFKSDPTMDAKTLKQIREESK